MVGADHLIGGFDGGYWPRFLVEHKAAVRYGAMKVFYDRFRPSLLRDWSPEDHLIRTVGEPRVSAVGHTASGQRERERLTATR